MREWCQLPGSFGRIFQAFPFLQNVPEWPHNMRIIPALSCKRGPQHPGILQFLYNFCVHRTWDIEIFRVFCANRTSRYCYFLIFLEFSSLSQNDPKHNKPSEAVGFPTELGHLSSQSTRIAAHQRLNWAVVIICGCCSRVLGLRGRFRQTGSLLKWHAKGGRVFHIQASRSQQKARSNC